MAIQCDYVRQDTPESVTTFKDAFWKINEFRGDDKKEVVVTVWVKESKKSAFVIAPYKFSFTPTQDGGEIRKQAYEYMMNLDRFSDAVMI